MKRLRIKALVILMSILLTNGFYVFPQEGQQGNYSFSLDEARDFAINNNTDVKNAELDIEAAKKVVWETTAIGLPHVNAQYDFQYIPGDLPTVQFDPNMPPIRLGVDKSATYNVTVSQLLFSGEYIVGLQASRTYLQLSQNALDKNVNDLKENISSAYFTILVLEKNKTILDSSVVNLQKIVDETKAYVENGFLEETNYEQLLITLNSVTNASKVIDRQIEISYKLFKIQVGLNMESNVTLTEKLDDFLLKVNQDDILSYQFKLEENIDYQMLETQERVNELSLRREKSTFLPSVSAFYLYQDKTNKADFDITFNNIVGVSASWPIFSSGQRMSKVSQAKIELEKSRNVKETLSESILMGVDQARFDFTNAFEKYETEKANLELTKKIYDKTVIKYKQGVVSGMELTQANNQYLESNGNYVTAILELLNAKVRLQKALNNL